MRKQDKNNKNVFTISSVLLNDVVDSCNRAFCHDKIQLAQYTAVQTKHGLIFWFIPMSH